MVAEWMEALPRLRQQVGERNFATWIEPIRCLRDEQGLCLQTPSRFFQEWVNRHFMVSIREALAAAGWPAEVRVTVAAEGAALAMPESALPAPSVPPPRPVAARSAPKIGRLVADYTFDSFVVGLANEVAYRAARAAAEAPGQRYNPLFVWGGVGLGKTHLINALAHEALIRGPRRRLACLSAEAFMNTLIASLRQDQMASFRDRFRDLDVLVLDDVQFLAGKERTQEEFFHTFDALHSAGRQIVLTSDKPPDAIAELEQRLRSRFGGGLIADIHPPTYEMRIAIALKKAARQGLNIPQSVAALVAERSGASVRELEGALTRVLASAQLRGVPVTEELADRVLGPGAERNTAITIEEVQAVVTDHFKISLADLTSHRRARVLTFPRQVAMYLSRTVARAPFNSIAEKFGGRDHSTVMYAVQRLEERQGVEPALGQLLRSLGTQLQDRHRI